MNELLWILAGIALGLVIEHVMVPWASFCTRSFRPTQRLWHFPHSRHGLLMATLATDVRVFRASKRAYLGGPGALVDEFDDVLEWLTEDQYTPPDAEEIYLVARKWLRPGSVHGVLYATLYRKFKPSRCLDKPRPMCFVTLAHVDERLGDRRLDVARDLWNMLLDEVSKNEDDVMSCDFFFQFPVEEGESEPLTFYWRFLREVVGARQVTGVGAPIPAFADDGEVTMVPALLLHARPDSSGTILPASDVAEFLYGALYLWAFSYQKDLSGGALGRGRTRVEALTTLSEELMAQANDHGDFELEPIGDGDAPSARPVTVSD
jgi:hypothetical protein